MSIANSHERNTYVDALRGIAMLMVVLQHTMVGCTDGAEQSFLFQIVWSLQMPLFMLISGYVTRYSRRINSGKALVGFIWKRTTAYLWPWLVWTVIIRGLVFGNRSFLNPSHILWHMDSGYWFLFSIWTISMAFGISQFCANVIIRNKSDAARILSTGTIYGLSMVLLAGIGYVFGLSFLCIKLTLYYMPFYFLGYLFGQSQEHLFEHKHANKCVELVVGVAFILWIVILSRYNLYEISDSGFGIIVRAAASLAGCIAVCGLMNNVRQSNGTANYGGGYSVVRQAFTGNLPGALFGTESASNTDQAAISDSAGADCFAGQSGCHPACNLDNCYSGQPKQAAPWLHIRKTGIGQLFVWIGSNSLEIYVLHNFFLNILKSGDGLPYFSVAGTLLVGLNFLLTTGMTMSVVKILHANRYLRKWLFAR